MAIQANISNDDNWFTGEDRAFVFTVTQSDGTTAQDVTGWTLSWMVKKRATDLDAAAVLTKTTSSGIALTTPAGGVVTVTVADTDTDGLTPQVYYHELKRTTAGNETVLSYGTALLKQAIHRS